MMMAGQTVQCNVVLSADWSAARAQAKKMAGAYAVVTALRPQEEELLRNCCYKNAPDKDGWEIGSFYGSYKDAQMN